MIQHIEEPKSCVSQKTGKGMNRSGITQSHFCWKNGQNEEGKKKLAKVGLIHTENTKERNKEKSTISVVRWLTGIY